MQLEDIKRVLEQLRGRPFAPNLLLPLQERLRAIDSKRVNGVFVGNGPQDIPPGQANVVHLLEECYGIAYEVQNGMRALQIEIADIKAGLMYILAHVQHPKWTDIAPFQDRLLHVQSRIADGKYQTEQGQVPPGQAQLFEDLESCYGVKDQIVAKIERKV